jgi:hypothetical protein
VRRMALLILFAAWLCSSLRAQNPDGDTISCYSSRQDNTPQKKKLWDGYEVSLGPARNSADTEYVCTAAIYNSAGRVVFRTSGFNVVFDQDLTGQDFDGDGKPDVVFRTDSGGGNHCCWAYIIFSLWPKPRKLFEIPMEGRVDFERDKNGKIVIWERVSVPGEFTSMAGRPFAAKVMRVREGKLVDVTQDFCGSKDERLERGYLKPEDLKKLDTANEQEPIENEDIISTLESRTSQHVFCHAYDEALKDINLWPPDKRVGVMKQLAEAFKDEYPEFVARLTAILNRDLTR